VFVTVTGEEHTSSGCWEFWSFPTSILPNFRPSFIHFQELVVSVSSLITVNIKAIGLLIIREPGLNHSCLRISIGFIHVVPGPKLGSRAV